MFMDFSVRSAADRERRKVSEQRDCKAESGCPAASRLPIAAWHACKIRGYRQEFKFALGFEAGRNAREDVCVTGTTAVPLLCPSPERPDWRM